MDPVSSFFFATQADGSRALLPWVTPVVLVVVVVLLAIAARNMVGGRFRWGVLGIGLAAIAPLVWTLGKGFEYDPHYIESPLTGGKSPVFDLPRLDGNGRMTLADLGGKPSVVNFWATWCIPCEQEHPLLIQAARAYGDRVNFVGIVYQDEKSKINSWLMRHGGIAFPILIDDTTSAALAFGVYGVPESYVLDAAGTIVHKFTGPFDPRQLQSLLDTLLSQRADATATQIEGKDIASIVGPPASAPITGDELREKTKRVAGLLRCPTCQGMSAGESPSDAARAIRGEVERLLAQGYDQEQILLYFEAAYGEFIRLDPKDEGFNRLVWVMPVGFVVIGLLAMAMRARAGRPPPAPAPVATNTELDPYLQKINEELNR